MRTVKPICLYKKPSGRGLSVGNDCCGLPDWGEASAGCARTLRQAEAGRFKNETYDFEHDELIGALLKVQPAATLDGLLVGDARDVMRGVRIIDGLHRHSLSAVPEDVLLDWCDQDACARYPAIACAIPISH